MTELIPFEQKYPMAASRGIDEPTWNTLKTSLYPGAKDDSILMVIDYCKSRQLDPLMKPVHIVPMSVKEGNQYVMRDVVMPGINTYRIIAARSKDLAGTSAPVFGPMITQKLGSINAFEYPEWCEVTVTKLIADRLVDFTAREYYLENYAVKKRGDPTPNAMWEKRRRGQLVKCAEAQALRKGWPEIGQQATYEEMVGKTEIDITPKAEVRENDMGAIKEAIVSTKPKKTTNGIQSVFDAYSLAMEEAAHPGELQTAFGEGWTLLKTSKAKKAILDSLKAIYEERKKYFESLEKAE